MTPPLRRILVAGASLAGVNAAQALRDVGFGGEITLVGDETHLPYDRPPLSKEAVTQEMTAAALALRPAAWYADNGITVRLGTAAALDPARRMVTLADGAEIGYDGLVIATGAKPRPLPMPLRVPGVLVLRRLEDAAALRKVVTPESRLLVIGAGFIGLEVAATARSSGAEVTVVEIAPVPLAHALGEQAGGWLARRHQAEGADIRCGETVERIEAGPGRYLATFSDGTALRYDAVVAATGVLPCTGWLQGSGLRVGDGVCCDAYCRTTAPDVVAAGDVARWYNPLFDEEMRIEHWTNGVEHGRAAALSLLGLAPSAYAPVPYFWSDQYGMRIRFAGRAFGATGTHVEERENASLVVLYQRDGVIRGTLCVDAMRDLLVRRTQILGQVPWEEAVAATTVPAPRQKVPD